jgi:high-affinity K+ transport system ATPase subunit B
LQSLETKLAELKAEQKAEQTYDADAFREVLAKDIKEYIKTAEAAELVELYNSVSEHDAVYNEESSSILIKTEDTKEIIADAEKLEQDVLVKKKNQQTWVSRPKWYEEKSDDDNIQEFTDQTDQTGIWCIKRSKYRAGNYDGAVEVIEKDCSRIYQIIPAWPMLL